IEKHGNWLYYRELGLGNGSEKAQEDLRENTALADEILGKVLAKRGVVTAALVPADADDGEEPDLEAPAPAPVAKGRKARSAE
ncbi:MAG: hypothetical protein K2W96_10495, partial [Gemmataceae bacterium]|nr:hypothetical protein [Gemmataceae bacterium]